MNQEHLEILKGGVTKWNKWRVQAEKAGILPDLREIDIVHLAEIDIVHLAKKDFSQANFRRVNFEGANLAEAKLCGADLSYANLNRAILSGANLKRAILGETTFKGTVLDGAKFHHASTRATTFINVNLSVVQGLDQVYHLGSSAIDFSTIERSKGNIPEAFLCSAGIPDSFMEYIRDLGKAPFNYYSCFISYADEDVKFAKHLYNDLKAAGARCWLAPINLKPGDPFPQYIKDAIHEHDKLIVVLSTHSIKSDWVEQEVELARKKGPKVKRVLFPIRLDDAYLSSKMEMVKYIKHNCHIGDFRNGIRSGHYSTELKKLLEALKRDET